MTALAVPPAERITPRAALGSRVPSTRLPGVLPLPLALLLALAGGLAYAFAFPAPNVWVLAFAGVGAILAALRGRGFATGLLVGFVAGLAFWFALIDWLTLFLGPVPLLALGTLEALIMALGGGLIAVTWRSVPLLWNTRWGRMGVAPLIVAAAWTSREVVASTFPYGGFGWGRFALSQATGPFAPLVAWFGVSGLGFVLSWLTAFAVACAVEPRAGVGTVHAVPGMRQGERAAALLPRVLAVSLAAAAVLAIPPFRPTVTEVLRVATVQPNTNAGYFDPDNDQARNLDAAVRATLPAIGRGVQLVVWPEGGAQYDPFQDAGVRERLDLVATAAGAPLLTGAITRREGIDYNSSLVWQSGAAITGLYDKVHPVPFAEYVPDRDFWTPFAPELLGLIGRDYAIGQRSSVLEVGGVPIGVDICFDIADDGLIVGSVGDGAELLVAQTNNADFGTTDEHEQQLAIARIRAIETGRSVVTSSTVASTAVIGPEGRTIEAAEPFAVATIVRDVPVATGTTPAVAFGIALGAAIALLGGLLPLITAAFARRLRRA